MRRSFISKLLKEAHHPSLLQLFSHEPRAGPAHTLPNTQMMILIILALMKIHAHSSV
jgi:hypothetical protein